MGNQKFAAYEKIWFFLDRGLEKKVDIAPGIIQGADGLAYCFRMLGARACCKNPDAREIVGGWQMVRKDFF